MKKKPSKSNNMLRWMAFLLLTFVFVGLLASLMAPQGKIDEVPLSDVIARANDENGNIKKITVEGSDLKITLKGEEHYTQISRKDPSGTLYEQGLIDQCASLNGEELSQCQAKYPEIEYKEASSFWSYAMDILII